MNIQDGSLCHSLLMLFIIKQYSVYCFAGPDVVRPLCSDKASSLDPLPIPHLCTLSQESPYRSPPLSLIRYPHLFLPAFVTFLLAVSFFFLF